MRHFQQEASGDVSMTYVRSYVITEPVVTIALNFAVHIHTLFMYYVGQNALLFTIYAYIFVLT